MNREQQASLVNRYLDGQATAEEVAALSQELESSEAARALYLRLAHLHAALAAEESPGRLEAVPLAPSPVSTPTWRRPLAFAAGFAGLALAAWLAWRSTQPLHAAPAHFTALQDCRWVAPATSISPGDPLRPGQPVELSSGQASIRFASGAEAVLIGPCIFEVKSDNSGFLTLGQIKARADGPAAKGFMITTRTARVVDAGTEFVAAAAPDGQSRVDVTSGEVTVHLEGVPEPQRLRQGDALSVEAGSSQVLVRIESGDGTAGFRFPTIDPPTNRDCADQAAGVARIRLVRGSLHHSGPVPSGDVALLLDGRGQSQADSPAESVFIADDADGAVLLDLGRTIAVSRINTYSWHQQAGREPENRVRAVQKYTLYGYRGDAPPSTEGRHEDAGWVRIARVDSDDFLQVTRPTDRPAQQACSISGARGLVGHYRYLLWELEPSRRPDQLGLNNTFYAEFDVHGEPSAR